MPRPHRLTKRVKYNTTSASIVLIQGRLLVFFHHGSPFKYHIHRIPLASITVNENLIKLNCIYSYTNKVKKPTGQLFIYLSQAVLPMYFVVLQR